MVIIFSSCVLLTLRGRSPSVEFVSGDSDENAWIGKIYDIKAREDDGVPWVKVYWYYSPSDLEDEFSSL